MLGLGFSFIGKIGVETVFVDIASVAIKAIKNFCSSVAWINANLLLISVN